MKGFVACAIASALKAQRRPLKAPLHLAFSYDEEIGCQGVRSMIDLLQKAPLRPAMCIVGEPTSLAVATGHKGKIALKARCIGREGHSALAPLALNALHLGCDFITALREIQNELMQNFAHDDDYDVPYTTVHAARITGGVALNIVPNMCEVDFEIRNVAEDDPERILTMIKARADQIVTAAKSQASEAAITFETNFSYPGLNTAGSAEVVRFVKSLTGANHTNKVAFGTEGGLFSNQLDIPTVVCGPGSMMQGHKPDEYVEVSEIQRCDDMLARLIDRLCDGLSASQVSGNTIAGCYLWIDRAIKIIIHLRRIIQPQTPQGGNWISFIPIHPQINQRKRHLVAHQKCGGMDRPLFPSRRDTRLDRLKQSLGKMRGRVDTKAV